MISYEEEEEMKFYLPYTRYYEVNKYWSAY